MPDNASEDKTSELHVVLFGMAQVAEVVHGCARLLSAREQDESLKSLGTVLERAANDLWELRRRLREVAPPAEEA